MRFFRLRRRRLQILFYLTTGINILIVLAVLYHEKIFNTIDIIQIPINNELCRFIPFNLSKF